MYSHRVVPVTKRIIRLRKELDTVTLQIMDTWVYVISYLEYHSNHVMLLGVAHIHHA